MISHFNINNIRAEDIMAEISLSSRTIFAIISEATRYNYCSYVIHKA